MSHSELHAFADGRLSSKDADQFREHLATCAQCEAGLLTFMQLEGAAAGATAAMPVPARAPRRGPRWLASLVGLASAAGLAGFFTFHPQDIHLGPSRELEARVSWAVADAHRPFDVVRGADQPLARPLSLEQLAKLEKSGDTQALAAGLLLSGDPARARALLEKLQLSPDVSADLSAVALAQGRPEDALELAQAALEQNPQHPRALWNRALAARDLGFTAVAAKTFGAVAALGEPGWAAEARAHEAALERQWQGASERFRSGNQAAMRMVLFHEAMPPQLVAALPSVARNHLAYALLTATSADEARALLPVAKQLDELFGPESKAVASVERAAAQPFEKRARLTAIERAMLADLIFRGLAAFGVALDVPPSEPGLDDAMREELGTLIEKVAEADDLVLILPMMGYLPAEHERYARAATRLGDPLWALGVVGERAKAAAAQGDYAAAEQAWLFVKRKGERAAPYRVMQANERLAFIYGDQHRAADQQALIFHALPLTRSQGDVLAEGRLLSMLGDAARFRNLKGLAAAALEERALRLPGDCTATRYFHESMALVYLYTLDPKRARAELAAARTCSEPLDQVGVFALADLIRLDGTDADRKQFTEAVAALAAAATTPSEIAMATHAEGRVLVDTDPVKGARLLREAMKVAREIPQGESTGRKAVSYSFGILRALAGQNGRYDEVLALTAEEYGRALPATCDLVVDVEDDRVTVAVRDGAGAVSGAFAKVPLSRPHPQWVEVSEISAIVAPLAEKLRPGCLERGVSVFAGYPLSGQGGWLPDGLPWSFASALPERPAAPGTRLVVSEVEAPGELKLPRLAARTHDRANTVALRGAEATPERVLAELQRASFVEIEAHGLVNPGSQDAAMVVLAPGAEGFALTVSKVREARLERHPVVLLGACRAATVAPYLHERWSLPDGFLQAGARAVIAAPVDLPDAEARDFFGAVVDRLDSGAAPAVAVAREREQWLAGGRSAWVRAVLVFE